MPSGMCSYWDKSVCNLFVAGISVSNLSDGIIVFHITCEDPKQKVCGHVMCSRHWETDQTWRNKSNNSSANELLRDKDRSFFSVQAALSYWTSVRRFLKNTYKSTFYRFHLIDFVIVSGGPCNAVRPLLWVFDQTLCHCEQTERSQSGSGQVSVCLW